MITMRVENEQIWKEYVKTGKVKGFSIEGFFIDKGVRETLASEQDKKKEIVIDILRPFIKKQQ